MMFSVSACSALFSGVKFWEFVRQVRETCDHQVVQSGHVRNQLSGLPLPIPMPGAPRPRKVRRFTSRAISVSGDGFMEIQNRASHDGHCRKLWKIPDLIFCGIERRLARFDELASIDRRSAEPD